VNLLDYPVLVFLIAFFLLWFAAWMGAWLSQRQQNLDEAIRPDFGVILAATLTLLGLIIGFSFSMATGRYDQRKTYEEAEANAIGTEYARADLLPSADAAQVRGLLQRYTDLRIRFYKTRDLDDLRQIDVDTAQVQGELWAAASRPAMAQPSPVIALAVAGMNDVLNSQGYTQAAWWNRIPVAAWALMFGIALFCNALLGYGARRMETRLFMVLPLVVAVSFFLIADIDSPRGGVIRVHPQNLLSLQSGFSAQPGR
jgi:lipopolysaccharide export LptBFGC system permease protein LptF